MRRIATNILQKLHGRKAVSVEGQILSLRSLPDNRHGGTGDSEDQVNEGQGDCFGRFWEHRGDTSEFSSLHRPEASPATYVSLNPPFNAFSLKAPDPSRFRLALLAGATICAMFAGWPAAAHACGKERWPVKTLIDRDADKIATAPVDATIAQLVAIPAPKHPNAKPDSRWPGEFAVYRVHAVLTLAKHEEDGDYHLVLSDDHGRTMIAEAPDPGCLTDGALAAQAKAARAALDARLGHLGPRKTLIGLPVTVTGVLFLDLIHGQLGVAPNGVELHPILSVSFGDGR